MFLLPPMFPPVLHTTRVTSWGEQPPVLGAKKGTWRKPNQGAGEAIIIGRGRSAWGARVLQQKKTGD